MQKTHKKCFIPLESNPDLFTELIHNLGVSRSLSFQDVLSIHDPELISFIPRPVHALILVFPSSPAYEAHITEEEASRKAYEGSGAGEDVVWFKQTIHNACGLYAILHAVCNGTARDKIEPDTLLSKLLFDSMPLLPLQRAEVLENSKELEAGHSAVALQGDSAVPENPEDEVDYHYFCFVKSHQNGHLFELDGDKKGPIDRGALTDDEDILRKGLELVRECAKRQEDGNIGFGLMVLVDS